MDQADPRVFLCTLFDAAVAAAQPAVMLGSRLPPRPAGRTLVLGAGKASAAMAAALEEAWDGPLSGLVVTRDGYAVPCRQIEIMEASHPVPDARGEQAARRMLGLLHGLGPEDLVICLISGGGSALLSLPPPGLTPEHKRQVNQALLRSGATISEMNCVRKHLSAIKGGRLAAAAAPARVLTYVISDVPGDDPAVIASGPTVADASTREQALAIIQRYALQLPGPVMDWLHRPEAETPKPGAPVFANTETVMLASAQQSLEAAAAVARRAGVTPLILSDRMEGEARDVGGVHASIALQVTRHGQPAHAPCVLLSGGETTVTVRGKGRGGRNAECALGMAVALDGAFGIHALVCDTDGIDGTEDNAGALVTPDTLARARTHGLSGQACLDANDAYGLFSALGDLVITGPTRTNVNDFRAVYIHSGSGTAD